MVLYSIKLQNKRYCVLLTMCYTSYDFLRYNILPIISQHIDCEVQFRADHVFPGKIRNVSIPIDTTNNQLSAGMDIYTKYRYQTFHYAEDNPFTILQIEIPIEVKLYLDDAGATTAETSDYDNNISTTWINVYFYDDGNSRLHPALNVGNIIEQYSHDDTNVQLRFSFALIFNELRQKYDVIALI